METQLVIEKFQCKATAAPRLPACRSRYRIAVLLKGLLPIFLFLMSQTCQSQNDFDSISISRSTIENDWHGARWPDSLQAGTFRKYLKKEKTVWRKDARPGKILPAVISLTNRIRTNGTEDVSKCFIPRHSINYYKNGKIRQYLLVCFECDGIRFSNEPSKTFIKSIDARDRQMQELKKLFHDIL